MKPVGRKSRIVGQPQPSRQLGQRVGFGPAVRLLTDGDRIVEGIVATALAPPPSPMYALLLEFGGRLRADIVARLRLARPACCILQLVFKGAAGVLAAVTVLEGKYHFGCSLFARRALRPIPSSPADRRFGFGAPFRGIARCWPASRFHRFLLASNFAVSCSPHRSMLHFATPA